MTANLPENSSPEQSSPEPRSANPRSQDRRLDPEELLARMRREEARAKRGRLKIFFGAAPGVGKSYAMLEAARRLKAEGVDVVVGYVELHGREETEALLDGLEVLPAQKLPHRGVSLTEFDVDAALQRHPRVVCVDELAHANHPGARHPKRWMDIEDLLDAGIDVYTTCNVQHVESLNDVVAQIVGVRVHETVPDRVFDAAAEIELVDLPPDDLLQRLREGKVYSAEKTGHALTSFFRKGNLIALRQLALRITAERVDAALTEYREEHAIRETWAAGEHVLVCIGPDPLCERLVRATRRLATALHASWIALYVETPHLTHAPREVRGRVLAALKLAETLGAETASVSAESVATEVLDFARRRNVSKIVIGKPARPRWRDLLRPTLVDTIVRGSGAADVYVITGDAHAEETISALPRVGTARRHAVDWRACAKGAGVIALVTLICQILFGHVELPDLVMLYLFGTVLVAARWGRWPSVLAAVLSVLAFDFLFVPPLYTFAVSDAQYLITFAVMLITALVISHLAALGKRQAVVSRQRERRASELYALSRELTRSRNFAELDQILRRHVQANFDGDVVVLLPDAQGHLIDPHHFCTRGVASTSVVRFPLPGNDLGIAQWAYDHRGKAGRNTDTLGSSDAIFLPLNALQRCIGVLGLRPRDPSQLEIPEQMQLLESIVNQAAVAMERVQLAETARVADVEIEAEKMRNALLSAISHDFRTPLTSIIGAASTLRDERGRTLAPQRQDDLLRGVLDEAQRLHRLVGNLLDLTRLSAGRAPLQRQWAALEEIVGAALHRLHDVLAGRPIEMNLPLDMPLLHVDEVLIEQLLLNLLENAQKYTPAGTPIQITATALRGAIDVRVRDHGPGLPDGEEKRVFETFHRGREEAAQSGFGLGLTICKAIVAAHGGEISARNIPASVNADGGAEFCFTLPTGEQSG